MEMFILSSRIPETGPKIKDSNKPIYPKRKIIIFN